DVIEVGVAEGDELAEGDSMIVLESDKASMEVPAPKAGRVLRLLVKAGDKIAQGDDILDLEVAAPATAAPAASQAATPAATSAATSATSAPAAADKKAAAAAPATPERIVVGNGDIYAGPAVRRLAREMGIDLTR